MSEPFGQGIALTLIGAGLVFLLLGILGVLIALLLRLDRLPARQGRQDVDSGSPSRSPSHHMAMPGLNSTGAPASELAPEMLAAVMVAVRIHRRIRRKQAAPAMRTHQPGTLPSRWVGAGRVSQNQSWQPRHH